MVRFSSRADAQRPLGLPRRALADQRDHRRPAPGTAPTSPGSLAALRPDRRVIPNAHSLALPELRRIGEERVVGRIGPGPAALDIVDAERVQLARDPQLVLRPRSRRPGSARRRAGWCRRGRCARRSCAAPVGACRPGDPRGRRLRSSSSARIASARGEVAFAVAQSCAARPMPRSRAMSAPLDPLASCAIDRNHGRSRSMQSVRIIQQAPSSLHACRSASLSLLLLDQLSISRDSSCSTRKRLRRIQVIRKSRIEPCSESASASGCRHPAASSAP